MMQWINSSLNRKFSLAMAAGLVIVSLAFLAILLTMYKSQIAQERSQSLNEINRLLQTSLENAMLKRDLDGLRDIIRRLGQQDGVDSVMILNPDGQVRFSSNPELLNQRFSKMDDTACVTCHIDGGPAIESTKFITGKLGNEVLRSVNAVANKQPCTPCHGSIDLNPVNGVLVVDSDAKAVRQKAWSTALTLASSGGAVVLISVLGGGWLIGRFVLSPVTKLTRATCTLAEGHLDTRVKLKGKDELTKLGQAFNRMAENLQEDIRIIKEKDVFLQGLIDAIPDGVRVIDSDFSIIAANKTYCEQLSQKLEHIIGTRCYQSSHHRDEPCPPSLVSCPLHEISRQAKPLKSVHQHIRSDGSTINVEVFAAPLKLQTTEGHHLYIVESIRDLEKQVQFSLEQKLATMGQLATGVAHEIRNPLASIRLALQSTLRTINNDSGEYGKIDYYLRLVDTEIDHCIDVTKRLLKLSEPVTEHQQLVSLNSAIEDIVSLLTYEALQRNVEIKTTLESPDVRILGSDSELRIIILNFLQNAFHAMPKGGKLQITTYVNNKDAFIIFKDTGVGISDEDAPHIFEPFFSHRADGEKGVGLGLAICKSIIGHYGGEITVESRVGEGTQFTLRLANADAENESDKKRRLE